MSTNHLPDMQKPKILYHASQNRAIKEFVPRAEKIRDPNEGPGVFATPDKAVASLFIVPTDSSWVASGKFNSVPFMVISDEDRFDKADLGGAIYALPSDSFKMDPEKGLGKDEWFSSQAVVPISSEKFDSGLKTMLQLGVQVFFTDGIIFDEIKDANTQDHGYSIIKSLVSENKKQGINYRDF